MNRFLLVGVACALLPLPAIAQLGTTTLLVSEDSSGGCPNADAKWFMVGDVGYYPQRASSGGRYVAFYSDATDLITGGNTAGFFIRDRTSGTTTKLATPSGADSILDVAVSGNGNYAVVLAQNPSSEDHGTDVWRWTRSTNSYSCVTCDLGTVAFDHTIDSFDFASIANDGGAVSFSLSAVSGPGSPVPIVVMKDLSQSFANAYRLVSRSCSAYNDWDGYDVGWAGERFWEGGGVPQFSVCAGESGDYFVGYEAGGDTFLGPGFYLDTGEPNCPGAGCQSSGIALFDYDSTAHVAPPSTDASTMRNHPVSVTGTADCVPSTPSTCYVTDNGNNDVLDVSKDGRFVVFASESTSLIPGGCSDGAEIVVHDRVDGSSIWVSEDSSGNRTCFDKSSASISNDGRFVIYITAASQTSADTDGNADVYLVDRGAPDANGCFDPDDQGTPIVMSVKNNGDQITGASVLTAWIVKNSSCGEVFFEVSGAADANISTENCSQKCIYLRTRVCSQ